MRWILYIVILALLFLAPLERVDVAKLLPIETVAVYEEAGSVVMETDTKHKGVGKDAMEALESLKKNTPAIVYLDTAKYLVVAEEVKDQIAQLRGQLKDRVCICIADIRGRVKEASKYLQAHGNLPENKSFQNEK
ncbi:MAG: hypothetical protein J6Q92_00390 [Oscillospiraceae bacterium]|nr:hypothetical protein [Oscillospiraceae bacterium]